MAWRDRNGDEAVVGTVASLDVLKRRDQVRLTHWAGSQSSVSVSQNARPANWR
jgi:hypothetical protein